MIQRTEMIDEVVVVGYGVQKKENLTGSVAAVNFKDVASMPFNIQCVFRTFRFGTWFTGFPNDQYGG